MYYNDLIVLRSFEINFCPCLAFFLMTSQTLKMQILLVSTLKGVGWGDIFGSKYNLNSIRMTNLSLLPKIFNNIIKL